MNKSIKLITFVILSVVEIVFAGCNKPDEPIDVGNDNVPNDSIVDHSGSLNGHGFVDLGLPSGLLWAVCNIGANGPEECGDYFAWGETATKDIYDWKQYKFSMFINGEYVLTKYCTDPQVGFNGFVDSLMVLEPIDDVAKENWGEGWRMPTREEWTELLSNTTNTMTVQNGVEGRLIESANGNSLFLPNTGFFLDDGLICPNLGIYWSSTLQTTFQIVAWSYHSDSDECHVCGTYERSRGHCVRAVSSRK